MRSSALVVVALLGCSPSVKPCSSALDCVSGDSCVSGRCVAGGSVGGGLGVGLGGNGASGGTAAFGGGSAGGATATNRGVTMMAEAICAALTRCEPDQGRLYGSGSACRSAQIYELQEVAPYMGATVDLTGAAGCAQALGSIPCASVGDRPNSIQFGPPSWVLSVPQCSGLISYPGPSQCVVGAQQPCDAVHTLCGADFECTQWRCVPKKGPGEECRSDTNCRTPLGCLPGDGGFQCGDYLAEGSRCPYNARAYDCRGHLTCANPGDGGVCRPRGDVGAWCDANIVGSCLVGLSCAGSVFDARCVQLPTVGAPCSGRCRDALCLSASPGADAGLCTASLSPTACNFVVGGTPLCATLNLKALLATDGGTACSCVPRFQKQHGDACTTGDECAYPSICSAGKCFAPRDVPVGSSCRISKNGFTYTSNTSCQSGVCDTMELCAPAVSCP